MKRGDTLSTALFSAEGKDKEGRYKSWGKIYHKMLQMLAYADDMWLINRPAQDLKTFYLIP